MKKYILMICLILFITDQGIAGGLKGPLFSDEQIAGFMIGLVVLHAGCLISYMAPSTVLRMICGTLYIPVLVVLLVVSMYFPPFFLLFGIAGFFYYMTIMRTPKSKRVKSESPAGNENTLPGSDDNK